MTRAMLRHGHSGQVPRASAQGLALPRGPALQPKFVCYFIQHDHQLQSVGQKCYRLLRRKHNAQTVCLYYVPQQECRTKIKVIKQARKVFMHQENYVNETSMDTVLGILFFIIFQARRGLKHPHACKRLVCT